MVTIGQRTLPRLQRLKTLPIAISATWISTLGRLRRLPNGPIRACWRSPDSKQSEIATRRQKQRQKQKLVHAKARRARWFDSGQFWKFAKC